MTRAILLEDGLVKKIGTPEEVIAVFMEGYSTLKSSAKLSVGRRSDGRDLANVIFRWTVALSRPWTRSSLRYFTRRSLGSLEHPVQGRPLSQDDCRSYRTNRWS